MYEIYDSVCLPTSYVKKISHTFSPPCRINLIASPPLSVMLSLIFCHSCCHNCFFSVRCSPLCQNSSSVSSSVSCTVSPDVLPILHTYYVSIKYLVSTESIKETTNSANRKLKHNPLHANNDNVSNVDVDNDKLVFENVTFGCLGEGVGFVGRL